MVVLAYAVVVVLGVAGCATSGSGTGDILRGDPVREGVAGTTVRGRLASGSAPIA